MKTIGVFVGSLEVMRGGITTQNMIERQDMIKAHFFHSLSIFFDRSRVGTDFGLW